MKEKDEMSSYWYDTVIDGAIVIGGDNLARKYQFWKRDGKTQIASGEFRDDFEAIDWFQKNYPAEFKAGVEMRCWENL